MGECVSERAREWVSKWAREGGWDLGREGSRKSGG